MRGLSARSTARAAHSMSPRFARAKPAIRGPRTSRAIACTDAKSPSDATGNPASITSTPSFANWCAMRSFSSWCIVQPGDCSPSRRVVSKKTICSAASMQYPHHNAELSCAKPVFRFLIRPSAAPSAAGGVPIDLVQLETFLAVAEERSFSRAALRLHRTQPAVSQAIAKLEADIGEVLLERSSRDGTLTPAGEILREYAHKMLNLRTEAGHALADLRSLQTGRLQVAANEYTCLYLLPLLEAFRRHHPGIKIAVQRALASRISDEVLQHSVELGVLSFRPDDPQLCSTVVYRDTLVCIVGPQHALARAGTASIRRLGQETFVAHNVPSPLRQKVIDAFRRHRTPLRMDVELPSLEAIKRFVEHGSGVALVPQLSVAYELASGALVPVRVPELAMERKLRLVWRKRSPLSHAGQAFLAAVEAHAAEHGPPFCFEQRRSSEGHLQP